MADKESIIAVLVRKLADGTATSADMQMYYGLCLDRELESDINALMSAEMMSADLPEETDHVRLTTVYNKVTAQIHVKKETEGIIRRRFWPRIAVAAAIATIVFGAGLFYYKQRVNQEQLNQTAFKNDIAPGKTGATLTLSSGKKIILSNAKNGQLAEESGVKIAKTADGQLSYEIKDSRTTGSGTGLITTNTLATAKGETYQVRLPDGTKAWLNAASSIRFPSSFTGSKQRRVDITGEVYLEVYKDQKHPFIVLSGDQKIEVLGTHFNVNSYADDNTVKTTLLEGAVRISSPLTSRNDLVLKPGQQSIFTEKNIQVRAVDIGEIVAWKQGNFRFVDQSVTDIMKQVARWYNVDVVYEDMVSDIKLNASISRNRNLSQVLKMMEKTDEVHFKIEGRKIFVRK